MLLPPSYHKSPPTWPYWSQSLFWPPDPSVRLAVQTIPYHSISFLFPVFPILDLQGIPQFMNLPSGRLQTDIIRILSRFTSPLFSCRAEWASYPPLDLLVFQSLPVHHAPKALSWHISSGVNTTTPIPFSRNTLINPSTNNLPHSWKPFTVCIFMLHYVSFSTIS